MVFNGIQLMPLYGAMEIKLAAVVYMAEGYGIGVIIISKYGKNTGGSAF